MDKSFPSVDAAVADIPDGASIAIGGFFTDGSPVPLIEALCTRRAKKTHSHLPNMGPGNEVVNDLVIRTGEESKTVITLLPLGKPRHAVAGRAGGAGGKMEM